MFRSGAACPRCGYALDTPLVSCPECGEVVSHLLTPGHRRSPTKQEIALARDPTIALTWPRAIRVAIDRTRGLPLYVPIAFGTIRAMIRYANDTNPSFAMFARDLLAIIPLLLLSLFVTATIVMILLKRWQTRAADAIRAELDTEHAEVHVFELDIVRATWLPTRDRTHALLLRTQNGVNIALIEPWLARAGVTTTTVVRSTARVAVLPRSWYPVSITFESGAVIESPLRADLCYRTPDEHWKNPMLSLDPAQLARVARTRHDQPPVFASVSAAAQEPARQH